MPSTEQIFASPPVAFLIVLAAMALLAMALKVFAIVPGGLAKGFTKPYACGEESNPMIQPDYRQFFPFAFFFTALHVVALMVTALPSLMVVGTSAIVIAVVYVLGAVIGLVVLYRK